MVKSYAPRKRRTRQHVIADKGVNYVEGVIIDAGHTAQKVHSDYGYDLVVSTFDANGFAEPDVFRVQVKAFESITDVEGELRFDVDVRDYNLWMSELTPVILVLFDASKKEAIWLDIQQFFDDDDNPAPIRGAKTVRVRVPTNQKWSIDAVEVVRRRKQQCIRLWRGLRHEED